MELIALDAFLATPLTTEPFSYVVTPGFIRTEALPRINADYPDICKPGSFPVERLAYGEVFRQLLSEFESDEFREAFEEKFKVDLAGKPLTVTVRGHCSPKDGRIHTDSVSKIITILIYLNAGWDESGGRLRLLRSENDFDDIITEIPPIGGTLLAFKRAENSWHGHKPFVGPRRVIQVNWLSTQWDQRMAVLRHSASASLKNMAGALRTMIPSRRAKL